MRKLSISSGDSVFYNPTSKVIEVCYNSNEFEIQPFEPFEINNKFMARHFERKYKYKGLVNITYNEGAKKLYKDYDEFIKAKAIEGLKAVRDHYKMTLAREQQAVNESALKNGSSVDNLYFKVGTFKEELEKAEKALTKMMKDGPILKDETNESGANQNSNKVQAK